MKAVQKVLPAGNRGILSLSGSVSLSQSSFVCLRILKSRKKIDTDIDYDSHKWRGMFSVFFIFRYGKNAGISAMASSVRTIVERAATLANRTISYVMFLNELSIVNKRHLQGLVKLRLGSYLSRQPNIFLELNDCLISFVS
jgi:hypothetical protein